jgi:SAM-dependent methyltransferase
VAAYIQLAQESARQRGVGNVRFIHADSSSEANGGKPRLPAEALSFDLLISRRGPVNWIEDARRVARPGAVLIQLNPEVGPPPSWNDELPQPLRLPPPPDWTMRAVILSKLEAGGLSLHSSWSFDVPETFPNPEELYIHLAWGFAPGEVPAYREVHRELEAVFHRHASSLGLDLRFRCFLWKAVVD